MEKSKILTGYIKWPFIIFILYSGLTFFVSADIGNFFKKIARLVGYFFLYTIVTQLSVKEKNREILFSALLVSIIVTDVPAIYMYFISPEIYEKSIYSTDRVLSEVGIMPKNNFGFFSCYMAFFLIYMYQRSRNWLSKFSYLSIFIIQTALLIMSYTRSAWISFVIAFPNILIAARQKFKLIVPVIFIMIVAISLFSIIYYGTYKDLTVKREYGYSSWHFRWNYAWPASIKAFQEKPILGWGLGNNYYALSKAANFKSTSHNDYLLLLVETGIIGILLYLWLLAALFMRTLFGIRKVKIESTRFFCVTGLAIFTAFIIGSLAEHLLQTPGATGNVITIIGIAHGAITASEKQEKDEIKAQAEINA